MRHIAGAWAYPPPTFRTHLEIAGDGGLIEFDFDDTAPDPEPDPANQAGDAPDVGLPSSPVSESPYTTQIKEFYRARRETPARVTPTTGWLPCKSLKPHSIGRGPASRYPLDPNRGGVIMKIGILSFAHHHAEAYIQNLRPWGAWNSWAVADEDRARPSMRGQHDARFFPSYADLLEAKPDGVIICSENNQHRPLVEMAASRSVHVLCEKPLATTLADAHAMWRSAKGPGCG